MTADRPADKKTEIRRLLDAALERLGPTVELQALESSWGDTLNDEEMLEWLRDYLAKKSFFDEVDPASEDLDELNREYRKSLTKH